MSEEEKKAIERIEDTFYQDLGKGINKFQKITLYEDDITDIRKLLNLVDKLQKEIAELKEKNTQLTNYLNDSYYVSADKIREIITEYQKQLQSADTERTAIMLSNFIMVLNDLLGEN